MSKRYELSDAEWQEEVIAGAGSVVRQVGIELMFQAGVDRPLSIAVIGGGAANGRYRAFTKARIRVLEISTKPGTISATCA